MNLISQSNFAKKVGVSRQAISDKMKRGIIPTFLHNERPMIDLDVFSIEDYVNNRLSELDKERIKLQELLIK